MRRAWQVIRSLQPGTQIADRDVDVLRARAAEVAIARIAPAQARFFGPGQTRAEVAVLISSALVGAALLTWYLALSLPRITPALSWWQVLIVGVIGYDLIAGTVTNATGAAKRWYHRRGSRRSRLVFIASHLVYLLAIALPVLQFDWAWLGVNAALLLTGAGAIEAVPLAVRRPLAAGWVLMAILLNLVLVPIPAALVWFVPFFFLKLLLFHQVPEAPLAAAPARTREN